MIQEYYDGKIDAGEEIDREIDANLAKSDIILLLISAAFMNSTYCWDVEMARALQRHHNGEACVIPIIVRPVEDGWQRTVFGQLKALPTDGKPVTKWANRDAAWADVANGIRTVVDQLGKALGARDRTRAAQRRGVKH